MSNLHKQWIAGFVDADGCFKVSLDPLNNSLNKRILLEFSITRPASDIFILQSLKKVFKCGKVTTKNDQCVYKIINTEHLRNHLIPYFEGDVLKSRKRQQFIHFRRIVRAYPERTLDEESFLKMKTLIDSYEKRKGVLSVLST